MTITVEPQPVPLSADAQGVVRVGGTRVTLDILVRAFRSGSSSEEICERYPTLDLADVYLVLAYYLRHTAVVDAYVAEQDARRNLMHAEITARFPTEGIRARLLARRDG